ncbi:hypothetical protein [Phenylobacterium sp.]|uniref:hypothetical protein n=1 Tax=Phenylobacterium sp. TaxID=1871053 RepID=UPI002FC7C54E
MYIQWFAKGIAGRRDHGPPSRRLTKADAWDIVDSRTGILSNWWHSQGGISPSSVAQVLTETNLDRHLHAYATFGTQSPFISVAAGCVERDALLQQNFVYSAVDTALDFATDAWAYPGAVFFGWTIVGLNPAVPMRGISESVRELNVYRRWSPYQLEGEITVKVNIPANQIERVEWWDPIHSRSAPQDVHNNPDFERPDPISNIRELF